ncbi:TlpA disulfide reductase family protein [Gammaproteobacteria bacterium]|nr:TlpA disulfide reductase family protein [Gammaproteobacteria bacterium]
MLRNIAIAFLAAAALYAGVYVAQQQAAPQAGLQVQVPRMIATTEFATPDGARAKLADYADSRLRLVNLWASWCPPCIHELPILQAAHERLAVDGEVMIIGLADDSVEAVRPFVDSMGISYPILVNDGLFASLPPLFGDIQGLPFTLALDRDDRVVNYKLGDFTADELAQFINSTLNDLPTE